MSSKGKNFLSKVDVTMKNGKNNPANRSIFAKSQAEADRIALRTTGNRTDTLSKKIRK